VILDTDGNTFGGFTPAKWDSSNGWKEDNDLKSFLFTLKNPHNVAARKFALKPQEKHRAILCDSDSGPSFYGGITVSDNCNEDNPSYACSFGTAYVNDTKVSGDTFFTGSWEFIVKEIEVFEITD
jgi:hypothetical protein